MSDEPPLQSLGELLDHWAGVRATAASLVTPAARLTFGELQELRSSIAADLKAEGIVAGDVVAFQLPNWAEAFALYHAVVSIGAVALPLLPALRDRDLAYMLHETHARLFVTPAVWRGVDHVAMAQRVCGRATRTAVMRPPHEGGPLLRDFADGQAPAQQPASSPLPATRGGPPGSLDAVCSIIFTSGTSGRPKAVLYTHRNLAVEGREMAAVEGIGAGDVLFVPASIGHVSGLSFGVYMPLHAGIPVCLLPDWSAQLALELIERERCSWLAGATPFLQGLVAEAQARPAALAGVRVFRCGGASVPPTLIRQARALGIDAYRSYGMSEHPTVSGRAGQAEAVCADSDGIVHPHIEARIVDPADPRRQLPPGAEGEITMRGPDMSLAYLRAEDTAASRCDGWLLSGDLGTLSAGGVLRVTGRKKDIIIRKGENIAAREIEDLLGAHPTLADVAVIGVADAERGEMVVCVVVAKPGPAPELGDLCSHLLDHGLAKFKLPERLVLLPQLPYNAGGKVRKAALQAFVAGDPRALDAAN